MMIFSLSLSNLGLAVCCFSLYVCGLYLYRAYFDPLSKFPGPKLAAATLWYEFYYDVVKKGRYTWEIEKMHQKYGPIIRINPYEIHILDPEFIDQVYPGSSVRTMKYGWAMKMFGLRHSFFATEDHDLHRIRRAAFAHYLSKASLQRLEPGIQSVVDSLVSRLHQLKESGKVLNLYNVYGALTGDIIGQYAFAQPYGFLQDPDFSPHWHHTMMDVSQNGHLLKQFGFLLPMMQAMPEWLVRLTTPQMMTLVNFQKGFRNQIIKVKEDILQGRKPEGQTNIFYDVLTNNEVRPQEKDTDYLQDEAQTIIGAGTVTTAHILAITHFHILNNPSILKNLQDELGTVMTPANPTPTWSQLEQLPYLTAVITEGLRIGYGVCHRLQRLFPDKTLQYGDYVIPTMTPVSMTSVFLHNHLSFFPDPRVFRPERFLEAPQLRKYLVPFSRGSRQCAGLNLAYAEFYLGLAAVFAPGRFDWELYETSNEDVETVHDFLNTCPRLDSKGIRVVVN